MDAILTRAEGAYTYTYDQYTVFYNGDHVYIGGKEFPVGQCCVDVLNLDDAVLDEINQRVRAFVPAARALLTEKTDSAAALAQEKLNAVWDLIFTLPVYRDLSMDEECITLSSGLLQMRKSGRRCRTLPLRGTPSFMGCLWTWPALLITSVDSSSRSQ